MISTTTTLYEELLGEAWRNLPAAFRDVHSPGDSAGMLHVERGDTWRSRIVASALGMPRASTECPVRLSVRAEEGRQRWERTMGESRLESSQWSRGPRLVERFGAIQCEFRVAVVDGALVFAQESAAFALGPLKVPLPKRIRPVIVARARPIDGGARVDVRISIPITGLLLTYSGEVRPSPRSTP